MKLPSKTICQLSALSRALTDPKADDFEAMDTHDMLLLVSEIARAHAKLEEEVDEAAFQPMETAFQLMAIKDMAATLIFNLNYKHDQFGDFYPNQRETAREFANAILKMLDEED